MITVENLNKQYGKAIVLKNISLTLNPGEITGIVGENGAGKTTLFKCLTSLENYTGNIAYTGGVLKEQVGLLPTEPYFLTKITGKEYLQLLATARNHAIEDFEKVNIFNLPLNKYAENYSTGMKKKLALTATLLQKNEVFIFDEPFNGVDIQSNVLIKEILLKLKSLGKVVILSSHIFSTLKETCDKIYHLKDGVIVAEAFQTDFDTIENNMKSSESIINIEHLAL